MVSWVIECFRREAVTQFRRSVLCFTFKTSLSAYSGEEGKLYAVSFFADIEDKYSIDSTNERISKTRADLAATFGLASDAFENNLSRNFFPSGKRAFPLLVRRDKNSHSTSYELERLNGGIRIGIVPEGFRRYGVVISDDNLCRRLRDEKVASDRAKGEQLPEAK